MASIADDSPMTRTLATATHCANGHEWEGNERRRKDGSRYCKACSDAGLAAAKAATWAISDRRRLDETVLSLRESGATFEAIGKALGIRHEAARQLYLRAIRRSLKAGERQEAAALLAPDPYFASWAAGFFDGEGSVVGQVRADTKGRLRADFRLSIAQTVETPLRELATRYGGYVRFKKVENLRHQDQWHWRVGGLEAEAFLVDVMPYLRVKDEVAKLGLSLLRKLHRQGWRVTPDEHAERIAIVRAIQAHNHKGRKARTP